MNAAADCDVCFDAPGFARAWLSVAQASGKDGDLPQLDRTVAIEYYARRGVRLVATDRYLLLTAWVPELAAEHLVEPAIEESPDRTVITRDLDARGKGLLAYVHRLAKRLASDKECSVDELPRGEIELRLTFDVRLPYAPGTDVPLEGMEPRYVVLEVPDTEQVHLDVIEARFPDWRVMQDGKSPKRTDTIALHFERIAGLAGLRHWNSGPLIWTFQGRETPAFVDVKDSDPHVTGLVMPVRWLTPAEQATQDSEETQS